MASGRIIRFNTAKGYGFIQQDGGGDDVFIHAEELRSLDLPATTGSRLQFNVLQSSRGLKACDVAPLNDPPASGPPVLADPAPTVEDGGEFDVFDVITRAAYAQEITEALIGATTEVTAAQIRQVREHLTDAAYRRGWLDD